MIEIGLSGSRETIVTEDVTANHMLSGLMPVYATPAMIAFMEYTCSDTVQTLLEDGKGTVGTMINIKHLNASPINSKITCNCVLNECSGRRLLFKVEAYDDFGLIGEGLHERFIIDNDRFLARVEDKAARLTENQSL